MMTSADKKDYNNVNRMKNPFKSLLDWFHGLNLQTPIKAAVVGGVFLLIVALLNGVFNLASTAIKNEAKSPETAKKIAEPMPAQARQVDTKPFDFAYDVIQSLSWAADARQIVVSIESSGNEATDAFNGMTNARIAIGKLERANDSIQRYANSKNEAMRVAVTGFDTCYKELISALNASIQTEEKLMNVSDKQQLGAVINDASQWAAQADEGWKLLVFATAASTHALIDNERLDDGKIAYLNITAAEKNSWRMNWKECLANPSKKVFKLDNTLT